jgi:hypothetical protein
MSSLSLKSLGHITTVLAAMYAGSACSAASNATPGIGNNASGGATGNSQNTGGTTGTGVADTGGNSTSNGTTSTNSVATGGAVGNGGATAAGGKATGGAAAGGGKATGGSTAAAGGAATGGAAAGGGKATGGAAAGGGKATGGAAAGGGKATGGAAAGGGKATGGAAAGGGKATGGAAAGGAPTATCDSMPTLTLPPAGDFSDKIGSASIDMIAIPGGTFTLGCDTGACDPDTSPVENITVSDYHIMKAQASSALWTAAGLKEGTWYDCMALAAELAKQTGHAYRIMTEAEFEYAAKKHLDKLTQVDATEEWAFNSWETKYSCKPGDVDPLGPGPGVHTQKTRRDKGTGDKITGRLIRSIDGIGPKCRLTVSDKTEYPQGYPPACSIKPPPQCPETENSYRDPRWVSGDDTKWTANTALAIGKFDFQTWDDGTAILNGKPGQWFTSNNIALVFVPSTGTSVKLPYMFLDCSQGSLISETSFMSGGFIGRFEKTDVTTATTKPTISGLKSGAELAAAAGADYAMVDMQNIPESARKQDPRLIDTSTNCWFQNNKDAGGTHNYRKDVDADEFRFAVIDGGTITMLANGKWWTVNNTFLHIEHSTGYVGEYLYALTSDNYFFHDSYMKYERADFRMFQKYEDSAPIGTATGNYPPTCVGDSCSKELAKGAAAPFYAQMGDKGKSTFTPAPCPAGGCK